MDERIDMKVRWKLVAVLFAGGLGALAWVIASVSPFLVAMNEQHEVHERVFMPFEELHAEFLYNGFGLFILEFHDHSLLSDANIERLLLLNEVPSAYNLIVVLETVRVTDDSIDTLGKLKTVDSLFVDKSGMTDEGVAMLKLLLPANTVAHDTSENHVGPQKVVASPDDQVSYLIAGFSCTP